MCFAMKNNCCPTGRIKIKNLCSSLKRFKRYEQMFLSAELPQIVRYFFKNNVQNETFRLFSMHSKHGSHEFTLQNMIYLTGFELVDTSYQISKLISPLLTRASRQGGNYLPHTNEQLYQSLDYAAVASATVEVQFCWQHNVSASFNPALKILAEQRPGIFDSRL